MLRSSRRRLWIAGLLTLLGSFVYRQALAEPPRPSGLTVQLSEASPAGPASRGPRVVTGTPLADSAVSALLSRLKPPATRPSDRQDLALRDRSQPPPKTGRTVKEPFPPPAGSPPPVVSPGPLKVLRYAPQGAVPIAPHLTINFNQPMVEVGSIHDLAAQQVPVTLTPTPPGKWRWIGTQTLEFEPTPRFPMATGYSVEIPAGTRSASGQALGQAVRFTFQTPPLKVSGFWPRSGPQPRQPVMLLTFDQAVDRQALLPYVELTAGQDRYPLRPATEAEIAGDETVRSLTGSHPADRQLALISQQALPPATTFQLRVKAGAPSAEGPLLTQSPQQSSFSTYEALRVLEDKRKYTPSQPLLIRFNNPLDPDRFDDSQVSLEPDLGDRKVVVSGAGLMIIGRTRGRTTYQVKLAGGLTDRFGQQLGREVVVPFNIGPARPAFRVQSRPFVVMDPKAEPRLPLRTVNHERARLRAWAVTSQDWAAFREYAQKRSRDRLQEFTPPGRLVLDKEVSLGSHPDQEIETELSLREAVQGGHAQLVVVIESALVATQEHAGEWYAGWVQVTDLALDAWLDNQTIVARVSRLADGSPVNAARLSSLEGGTATSDAQGLAELAYPATGIVARLGDDEVLLPHDTYGWGTGSWQAHRPADRRAWYVVDDRGMYRPGEEVHIKGWVRTVEGGPQGGLAPAPNAPVEYVLKDSRGNEILKGQAALSNLGGFAFQLQLPDTMNLGRAQLNLVQGGDKRTHTLQVQEFRRPEFEVKAASEPGSVIVGESGAVSVTGTYYAGGGLPDAQVDWTVTGTPTSYSPPGWPGYAFGVWRPWWEYRCWWLEGSTPNQGPQTFRGHTDAQGQHRLKLDFKAVDPPQPYSVTAQARVTDVNRQAWAATTRVLVHPADRYVGLKAARTFVRKGQPLPLSLVVTDRDGRALAGQSVDLKVFRLDSRSERGKLVSSEADVSTRTVTSAAQPVALELPTGEGGIYQIEARLVDSQGRANRCLMTMWVTGGPVPASRSVEQEAVTLIPDRQEYAPGEVAEIMVSAPFSPAYGLLTTRREGLVSRSYIRLQEPTTTLKVPLEAGYIPNLEVQVDLVGSAIRVDADGRPWHDAAPRPALASGSLTLSLPPRDRYLKVEVEPAVSAAVPGSQTEVGILVKDSQGAAVPNAEVALLMVDEAVLALSGGHPFANPVGSFYPRRGGGVNEAHLRSFVLLNTPAGEDEGASSKDDAPGGGDMRTGYLAAAPRAKPVAQEESKERNESRPEPQIAVRSDFNPVAAFRPDLKTDAQGRVRATVKLPDNLTRYRLVALTAGDTTHFGSGEASLTARLPLMVRPSAPRFLNFGDRCELPFVVQNQTDHPLQVQVAVRTGNLKLVGPAGKSVNVPAQDRVEVRFTAETEQAGTARIQVAAAAEGAADAAEVSLPVWTPATTEAFATYGTLDEGAVVQPVLAPSGVFKQFGGLEITTTSTALAELTDAFLYLQTYPFECSEQLSSRILSVAALRDVLQAFQAPGLPAPAAIEQSVKRDLERLAAQQNPDGGFDFWVRGKPSLPFLSIHVGHALARARAKGYPVPTDLLARNLNYLRAIERHIPADYPESCRRALRAYALYVRRLLDDPDPGKAKALVAEVGLEKLPLESIGWLLPTLKADKAMTQAMLRILSNRATETASTAQFAAAYGDGDYLMLYSDRRLDAILLEALIEVEPKNPLIPKLVRGLLDHRVKGRWSSTQENCFILLALDRYFQVYEKTTPDLVARVWLGDSLAGNSTFKGRSTDSKLIRVPMDWLQGRQNLTLSKQGQGRLYYRIGMTYAPTDLRLPPYQAGFTVNRSYAAVDDNRDVRRERDGTWHVRAGATVRVNLTMVNPSRRYHVALVDPLPAGLEALNPVLAVTGKTPSAPVTRERWWWGPWFQHQNLRDERVEAFTTLLWEGVHTYSYLARATTPGTFVVPPPKAEEMYHPETFGRGAGERLIVE